MASPATAAQSKCACQSAECQREDLGPATLILHLVRDKMKAVDKLSAESGADYTVDLPIIPSFGHPDRPSTRPTELLLTR